MLCEAGNVVCHQCDSVKARLQAANMQAHVCTKWYTPHINNTDVPGKAVYQQQGITQVMTPCIIAKRQSHVPGLVGE
jgi:hypothetical protein